MLRSRFAIADESRRAHRRRGRRHRRDGGSGVRPSPSAILQDTEPEDRPRLLAMAYRVAAVDGFVHEFEDDLVWRIGRLLGFGEDDIAAIREDALRNLAPERADGA